MPSTTQSGLVGAPTAESSLTTCDAASYPGHCIGTTMFMATYSKEDSTPQTSHASRTADGRKGMSGRATTMPRRTGKPHITWSQ